MPQHLDRQTATAKLTLSTAATSATAVTLPRGTGRVTIRPETTAAMLAWDGEDGQPLAHYITLAAGVCFQLTIPSQLESDRQRDSWKFAATALADGDIVEIDDGTTTVTFEFDDGGGVGSGHTAVSLGVSVAAAIANLVAAINASALNARAEVHYDDDARADIMALTTAPLACEESCAHASLTPLGSRRIVFYLDSTTSSQVVELITSLD